MAHRYEGFSENPQDGNFFPLSLRAAGLCGTDNCRAHLVWRRKNQQGSYGDPWGEGENGFERIVSPLWNFYIDGREAGVAWHGHHWLSPGVVGAGCTISEILHLSLRSGWVCRTWVDLSVRVF